jgi:type IV secretory pathway TraG/TraD family ATPase VirD4
MSQGAFSITAKLFLSVLCSLLAGFLGFVFFSQVVRLESEFAIYGASIVFGAFVFIVVQTIQSQSGGDVERGEILISERLARFRSWWKTRHDPYKFFWGGLYIPYQSGNMGLVAVGAPSSGKTVSIRLFLQSVLPLIGQVPDHRAIIYDAKSEMMPILSGMGIDTHPQHGHVKILNPYDTRSYYWEMWRDITDIDISAEIALLFIPVNHQAKEPVWDDRARSILKGVLDSFILTKKEWSLRDLCAATLTKERIEAVLAECPSTKSLIASKLGSGKPAESVVFSLQAAMEKYHNIASLWDSMPEARGISFYDWLNNPNGSILLLGRARDGTPLGDINKLMIARIGQLIAEQNDLSSRRTWIIIDELRQCGRLDLSEIATTGRGRGASLVLGYQDNNGLKDAYGVDGAKELLGMCQHKAIFRLSSESTAHDAAGEIGQQDVRDDNGQERTRYAVLPWELTSIVHIPETNVRNGLTGYYKSTAIGAYKLKIKGQELFHGMLDPIDQNVEGFKKVRVNDFPFEDWTESDLARLGYVVAEGDTPPTPQTPPTAPDEEQFYNEDGTPYAPPDFDFSGFSWEGEGDLFDKIFNGKATEENTSGKRPPQSKAGEPTPKAKPNPDDNDPFGGIGRRDKKAKGKDKGTFTKEDLEKSIQNGRWDA